MLDWQIALLVSAVVFAAFIVFKMRPAVTRDGRATAADLEAARKRVEAATDDAARGSALADAGDACARLGRVNSAVGFYLRALRAEPTSAALVKRAADALTRRPTSLETMMWRLLAAQPWTGDHRPPAIAALRVLTDVYGRRHRTQVKKQAIEHLLAALGEPPPDGVTSAPAGAAGDSGG